jgi:hypothetical protein
MLNKTSNMKKVYLYFTAIAIILISSYGCKKSDSITDDNNSNDNTDISANWESIAGFNQVIFDLKSYDGKLFIGGNFTACENSASYWSAYYEGGSIIGQPYMIGGSGIKCFESFNNSLYATGSMGSSAIGVNEWDGTTWDTDGGFNTSQSGIYADGTTLYVGGEFYGQVSTKTSGSNTYNKLPAFDEYYDGVNAITKYNNSIIVAGDITSYNGIEINNVASWDGYEWQALGDGISGEVLCMSVFNNELYVGGKFSKAGGNSIANIAKWDGNNWTDVGGSLDEYSYNGVRDMAVYNGYLYAVGDFEMIGGDSARYVARWNGNSWEGMSLKEGDSFVNCVEIYNNELYVGTFDTDSAYVFKRALTD